MLRTLSLLTVLSLAACASPAPVVYSPPVSQADLRNPHVAPAPAGTYQPNAYLKACPGMSVSNAPQIVSGGWIAHYKPVIRVQGVVLASVPANDVCLTSGFGYRHGRQHEGIDLQARPAGTIYATAPGRILEARNSRGYGLQVLIDHGKGVYTRYAHLDWFSPGVAPGKRIGFGQPVGQMGSSGNATAVHVHYEILTGNYKNPRGSKGLTPRDPFSFPAYEYAEAY